MEVICREPGMDGTLAENIEEKMDYGNSKWNTWSSSRPPGTAVCALKTRVQETPGSSWISVMVL